MLRQSSLVQCETSSELGLYGSGASRVQPHTHPVSQIVGLRDMIARAIRSSALRLDRFAASFNGSLTSFALTVGGKPFNNPGMLLVTVNGVLQELGRDYSLAELPSSVVFAQAPLAGWDAQIIALGVTPEDIAELDPDNLLSEAELLTLLNSLYANNLRLIEIVNSLPTAGNVAGRVIYLTADHKLYLYRNNAWISFENYIAPSVAPTIPIVDSLPLTGSEGDVVLLSVDSRLYAFRGGIWVAVMTQLSSDDVVNYLFERSLRPLELLDSFPTVGNVDGRIVFIRSDQQIYIYISSNWVNLNAFLSSQASLTIASVSVLPATGGSNEVVYLTTDQKLYIYRSNAWELLVPSVTDADIRASLFNNGLRPVEIVTSLPITGNVAGRVAYLTTDQNLYVYRNGAWLSFPAYLGSTGTGGGGGGGTTPDTGLEIVDALPTTGNYEGRTVVFQGKLYIFQGGLWVLLQASVTTADVVAGLYSNGLRVIETVAVLPTTGNVEGRVVYLTTDSKLYIFTGGGWISFNNYLTPNAPSGIEVFSANPTSGNYEGRVIFNSTLNKLYRYTNGNWVAVVEPIGVATTVADGSVTTAKFAAGIAPVEILSFLPTTGNFAGRMVFNSTDGKLYRYTGSAFVASVAAGDVSGQIAGTQLANGAIGPTQLAANSIIAGKIAAGAISATEIATGAITTAKLFASAVTAEKIAALAVTAGKIAANAVTTDTLAADAVTAGKIQAGAIGVSQLAAGAVTADKIGAGAITTVKLQASSVTAETLAALSVTAAKLAVNAVTADKIAANAVSASKIQAGSVGTDQLAAGAVTADRIAAGTITSAQIETGGITASNIAANTITSQQLSTGQLITTSAQLGNSTVTTLKIGTNAVTVPVAYAFGPVDPAGSTYTGSFTLPDAANVVLTASIVLPNDLGYFINNDSTDYTAGPATQYYPVSVGTLITITIDGTVVYDEIPGHFSGNVVTVSGSKQITSAGVKSFSIAFTPRGINGEATYRTGSGFYPRNIKVFLLGAAR